MSRLTDWIQKPKIVLLIFKTYLELRHWMISNKENLMASQAVINRTLSTVTFPNGAKIYLGHAETEEDCHKYYGLEYDIVIGTDDQFLKIRQLINKI